MMHVNMLQLRYYADLHGMVYNNTLLITPKESLSAQHVGEMELSGIQVQMFPKREEDCIRISMFKLQKSQSLQMKMEN